MHNPMQYPPVIEKRIAVGNLRRLGLGFHRNVPMVAVLCNGVTIAQFLYEDEADRYIKLRWPNRKRHALDNWTKR